ncbi:transposable element Tcb2 transposase [Trichonephila clavipes]|nr:transposable element Tcb2 transposase [Trichonephila clavipes]
MTAQRYVHGILQPQVLSLMKRLPGAIFQQVNARLNTARASQDCLSTVTTLLWPFRSPIFRSNPAYLGSFGTASWLSYEFEQTRVKITANMELNVSRHNTKLLCLNV